MAHDAIIEQLFGAVQYLLHANTDTSSINLKQPFHLAKAYNVISAQNP